MKMFTKLLLVLLCARGSCVLAQGTRQDPAPLRQATEQFLRMQTAGLPGQVSVVIGQIDPRMNLAACAALEPFLPNGSRAWGKTTVGVRCNAPTPWTIYVSATVRVLANYIVTAAPLAQGQTIGQNDIATMHGDIATLPPGIITDASQALGRAVLSSLSAGSPLRQDSLRSQQAVQQGQTVRLVSIGTGFRVSTEGKALNNAAEGQLVQARTPAGQVVSGIAKLGGILEVSY
jgi:flagella basal body P-ring formation protein FlgA